MKLDEAGLPCALVDNELDAIPESGRCTTRREHRGRCCGDIYPGIPAKPPSTSRKHDRDFPQVCGAKVDHL